MQHYYIYTDSESQEIEAESVEGAIEEFDPVHSTWDSLSSYIERVGGWVGVQQDGVEILFAGKR